MSSFSTYYPYETRETVRYKLRTQDYTTRSFRGRSSVWDSFLVVTTAEGVPVNYVLCRKCCEVFMYRGHSSGTSTLRKHAAKCTTRNEQTADDVEPIAKLISLFKRDSYTTATEQLGEDRKLDLGGGDGGSGPPLDSLDEGALSPEQFMSEDMDSSAHSPTTPQVQRPESYKLRHNNHLTLVLESLAGDESFMDVTLTAQGKAIKAHKSVLSAVSPYFRSVLKQNPCQHPIIIMPRDVCFEELTSIISYIYKGEMTVGAEDLASLLKTAETLQVTGLTPPETSAHGLMHQMGSVFPPTGEVSTSFKDRNSTSKQAQQTASDDGDAAGGDESGAADQNRIDPLDFLTADMTCVKEEITSDNEEMDHASAFVISTTDEQDNCLRGSGGEDGGGGGRGESSTPNTPPLVASSSGQSHSRRNSTDVRQVSDAHSHQIDKKEDTTPDPISSSPMPLPFVCPHCLDTHRPVDVLRSHMRLKHASKPAFVCNCACVFGRQSTFAEHAKHCRG